MELTTSSLSDLGFKHSFEERLRAFENQHQGSVRKPWSNERIKEVIDNVKNARISMTNTGGRTSMSYYWLSKYDIITKGNEQHLVFKRKKADDPIIRILPCEEYFSVLYSIHKDLGHGGRDKMVNSIKSRFYIAKKAVEIFVSLCPTCNNKRNIPFIKQLKRKSLKILTTEDKLTL